jgi:hypothetical protein
LSKPEDLARPSRRALAQLPTRQVRVSYERADGGFANRHVTIRPEPNDDDQSLMQKARDEYHRRYGYLSRIVAIDVNRAG